MNLRRLEYFVVLAQTGGLRKASEILRVSPPALSKAMRLLEEEAEASLWIRSGKCLALTDAGKTLLRRAPQVIEELALIKDSLRGEAEQARAVRIGTFEVFSTYFLSFLEKVGWEERALEMHELLPGEVERHVAEGDVDVGLTYIPIPDARLDFLKVASIEMGVFVRKGAFKGVAQPDLPFVIPVLPLQGVPTKARGLDGWPEDAFRRKVLHRVTLMESALELCRQGRVAGYFPAFVAREHNKRVRDEFQLERRSAPAPCRLRRSDVFLVKRKSSEEGQTIKQLAKAVRLVCE